MPWGPPEGAPGQSEGKGSEGSGGKSLHCGFLGKEWASRLGRVRIGDFE